MFFRKSPRQAVGLVEDVGVLDDGTLHLSHAAHDVHHPLLLVESQWLVGRYAARMAHESNVSLRVVAVAAGSPPSDDFADGVGVVLLDVIFDEHEGGSVAPSACGELHESLVRLLECHALPVVVAVSDVERVVVADAAGQVVCLFHNLSPPLNFTLASKAKVNFQMRKLMLNPILLLFLELFVPEGTC